MDEETGLLAFGALVAALLFIAWRSNLDAGDVSGGDASADAAYPAGDVMTGVLQNLGLVNSNADQDTLARTIWGEARGESYAGQQGVGCVVRNRVKSGGLFASWPANYAGVCQQPLQFSCWNANDPNFPKVQAVNSSDLTFEQCLAIAAGVMDGSIPDNTGGATHYHDTSIAEPPSWLSAGYVRTGQIGRLIFYREA